MTRRSVALLVFPMLFCALASAQGAHPRNGSVTFTPPPEPGFIYVVVDFPRSGGTNQPMRNSIVWGDRQNSDIVSPNYSCRPTTPAGAVIRIRHRTADTTPLTFNTTGTIIRGPYQGENPPEQLHACYKLVKFI